MQRPVRTCKSMKEQNCYNQHLRSISTPWITIALFHFFTLFRLIYCRETVEGPCSIEFLIFVSFANKKFEGYHIEIQSLLIYILEQCCRTCISCICKLFVFISSQMYCDFFNEFRRSRNFVIFFQKKKLRFNLKNFLDQPDLL